MSVYIYGIILWKWIKMNCNRFNEIEEKNLFNKLSKEELIELKEHIDSCDICKAKYELYNNFNSLLSNIKCEREPAFIVEKVNDKLNVKKESSLFDFLFGVGHNPIKAGFAVGLSALVLVVLSINIVNLSNKTVSQPQKYVASASVNSYTSQFYNKWL